MGKEEFKRAIQSMIKGMIPTVCMWFEVVAIQDKTCTILIDDVNDLKVEGILLGFNNSGVIVKPSLNSNVLVLFTNNSKTNGFVVCVEETDDIEINGMTFGGLVKINALKTEMAKLEANINILKAATLTAISVYSGALDGGASASAFSATIGTMSPQNLTQLENTKVKHGG